MPEWSLRVKCSHCGRIRRVAVRNKELVGKRTGCWHCGKSFIIYKTAFNNQLVFDKEYARALKQHGLL